MILGIYIPLYKNKAPLRNWYGSQWDKATIWQLAAQSAQDATIKHTEQDIRIGEQVALSWLVRPIFKWTLGIVEFSI